MSDQTNNTPPETEHEVDAYLREHGYDPEKIGREFARLARNYFHAMQDDEKPILFIGLGREFDRYCHKNKINPNHRDRIRHLWDYAAIISVDLSKWQIVFGERPLVDVYGQHGAEYINHVLRRHFDEQD